MNSTAVTPHPDQLLDALKKKTRRSDKIHNLEVVHQVCADIYAAGGNDYSYALVGRMSERQGGLASITLYSKASEDYRALIVAWANYAKTASPKRPSRSKLATDDDLLEQVDDPTIRMLLSMAIAERNILRKQLDTLRSHANITVDMRSLPGASTFDARANQVLQIITPAEGLTKMQRESLERAIAPATLKRMGWLETADGEVVVQHTGEVLFGPGYTHAIRSLISAPIA